MERKLVRLTIAAVLLVWAAACTPKQDRPRAPGMVKTSRVTDAFHRCD